MIARDDAPNAMGPRGRLYHAASSYYSMIARLSLAEAGIAVERSTVDIHAHMEQLQPDYVRLNPNMTVPTLVLPGRILDQSRDVMEWALGQIGTDGGPEARQWVDRHYAFPIEQLTFGWLLSWNPLARWLVPGRLAGAHRRLEQLAVENPDLAAAYRARAEVFAERMRIFNPAAAKDLFRARRAEALQLLDDVERSLADGRPVLAPPSYGCADVVITVFLARMEFVRLGREIAKRPSLARYYEAMRARPSFAAADVWRSLHLLRMISGMMGAHTIDSTPPGVTSSKAA